MTSYLHAQRILFDIPAVTRIKKAVVKKKKKPTPKHHPVCVQIRLIDVLIPCVPTL